MNRNVLGVVSQQPGLTPAPGNAALSGQFPTCYAFHLKTILYSFQEKKKERQRKKEGAAKMNPLEWETEQHAFSQLN